MNEQQIQAAAERVRRVIAGERTTSVYSIMLDRHDTPQRDYEASCLLLADKAILANAHPLVSPPPILGAADGEGWWWHVDSELCASSIAWVVKNQQTETLEFDGGAAWFPAAGGLWQRVIGPFGWEGLRDAIGRNAELHNESE